MDQLHEELKEPLPEPYDQSNGITVDDGPEEDNHSQSDNDFQSCESCGSSERADNEVQGGNVLMDDTNEAEMLIPEQDEIQANREWQKEKNMINDFYRSGVNGVMGGSTGVDMDKDVDTTTETIPIISSQGAIKVQGRTSGNQDVSCFILHKLDHILALITCAASHLWYRHSLNIRPSLHQIPSQTFKCPTTQDHRVQPRWRDTFPKCPAARPKLPRAGPA